jgi:hypothetical protein
MNEKRLTVVKNAFSVLDNTRAKKVPLDKLIKSYNYQ